MAAAPQQQQSEGMTAAQFAYLLWQQQQANGEAGNASAAARDLSQNYTDRANAQINTGDVYYDMLKALQGQLMTTTGQDEGDLKNRTDQITSSLNGTVDRAAALAGSQAGAQLRKRGMGDSTQAASSVNDLTRQYGEVYQKLQEMARQRAFDELKSKQGLNQQLLGTVGTGLSSANNSSLTNAREMSTAASLAASTARQNVGAKTQNVLESKLMEAMLGSKAVKGGIDDGINFLGDKVKSLFAPAAFDPEAFYSAPKETASYTDWKASEQAANGVTPSSALPISEMLDPAVLGTQEPVWFNDYSYKAPDQADNLYQEAAAPSTDTTYQNDVFPEFEWNPPAEAAVPEVDYGSASEWNFVDETDAVYEPDASWDWPEYEYEW